MPASILIQDNVCVCLTILIQDNVGLPSILIQDNMCVCRVY